MSGLIDVDRLRNRLQNLSVMIDDIPTVEAESIRYGHWIKMSDIYGYYYACSECGEELYREWSFDREFDPSPRLKSIDKTRYCPHCGVKMNEVEE